jgi:hypothetical protein
LAIALFYFTPFRCHPCYAIHDFVGSKIFAIVAFDLSLFISALIYTAAPDSWPSDFMSQFWIVLSFFVFFYFIFDVLWVMIFPLTAMSLMSPIWVVIQDVIRSKWKYAFNVNASDDLILATFIVFLIFTVVLTILLFYYRFLHRLYYSIVLSLLMVIALKTMIHNVGKGSICCNFTDENEYDQCPILLSTTYLIIFIVVATLGLWLTMYKYKMLCYSESSTSKSESDKVIKQVETPGVSSSTDDSEPYNRIDLDQDINTEMENLLHKHD